MRGGRGVVRGMSLPHSRPWTTGSVSANLSLGLYRQRNNQTRPSCRIGGCVAMLPRLQEQEGRRRPWLSLRQARSNLKEASRIQALLCVYFLALLTESLLERGLHRAVDHEAITSLPLYPEGRKCRRPTARRVIDLFEDVQRHSPLRQGGDRRWSSRPSSAGSNAGSCGLLGMSNAMTLTDRPELHREKRRVEKCEIQAWNRNAASQGRSRPSGRRGRVELEPIPGWRVIGLLPRSSWDE